jgi:8-oxo-dGTP diphosphatase
VDGLSNRTHVLHRNLASVTPPLRTPVVGAAILLDGAVLAARRTAPVALAGRWEFPGGKVEPDESPEDALVREIAEELGCRIELTGWLPGSALIGDTHELRVACGVLTQGEPSPTEHDLLRWVRAEELDAIDWLDPDRPFLPALRERLQERMGS